MTARARKRSARALPAALVLAVAVGAAAWALPARAQQAPPAQRLSGLPVAAAPVAGSPGARITISAREYSFDAPDAVATGIVSVTLRNDGAEPHQAQFLRLREGVSLDQLGAALQQEGPAALQLVTAAGGPNTIDPGNSQEVTLDVAAGSYVMLCFVSGPDNVPHFAKGMIKPFSASPPPSQAQAPQADVTVTARDFSFTLPQISAGPHQLRLVNQGPQPHEASILKIPPGVTQAELQAALQNFEEEPPFQPEDFGGLAAIEPGLNEWGSFNFTPGTYVMLCFVPDRDTGKPHAALGMVSVITVQ